MSKKFVVLECKGKQYIVSEGDVVSVDLIHEDVKKKLTFDNVFLTRSSTFFGKCFS